MTMCAPSVSWRVSSRVGWWGGGPLEVGWVWHEAAGTVLSLRHPGRLSSHLLRAFMLWLARCFTRQISNHRRVHA